MHRRFHARKSRAGKANEKGMSNSGDDGNGNQGGPKRKTRKASTKTKGNKSANNRPSGSNVVGQVDETAMCLEIKPPSNPVCSEHPMCSSRAKSGDDVMIRGVNGMDVDRDEPLGLMAEATEISQRMYQQPSMVISTRQHHVSEGQAPSRSGPYEVGNIAKVCQDDTSCNCAHDARDFGGDRGSTRLFVSAFGGTVGRQISDATAQKSADQAAHSCEDSVQNVFDMRVENHGGSIAVIEDVAVAEVMDSMKKLSIPSQLSFGRSARRGRAYGGIRR